MTRHCGRHGGDLFLLADYRWHAALPEGLRTKLEQFAAHAAEYDREPGFTDLARLPAAQPDARRNRYLVVTMPNPDPAADTTDVIVALLVVTSVDETGIADILFVVAPEHRSHGVATRLMERLRDDADGWFGAGATLLRFAANGPHPAAERLAARFGARLAGERWLVIRGLPADGEPPTGLDISDTVEPPDLADCSEAGYRLAVSGRDGLVTHSVRRRGYRPHDAAGTAAVVARWSEDAAGQRARIAFLEFRFEPDLDDDGFDAILRAVFADLRGLGLRAVVATIDPDDTRILKTCLRNDFQHDQTNLQFSHPTPG